MSENILSANCFFPLPFLITFKARKFRSARELLLPVPKVGLENFRCFSSERRRRSSDSGNWSAKRYARRFRVTMSSSSVLLKKKISTPFDSSSFSTIVRLVCKISLNDAYLIRCNRRYLEDEQSKSDCEGEAMRRFDRPSAFLQLSVKCTVKLRLLAKKSDPSGLHRWKATWRGASDSRRCLAPNSSGQVYGRSQISFFQMEPS